MNQTLKRHLISAGVTFATGFAIAFLIDIDKITLATIADGTIAGFVFTAIRAGVKALLELVVAKLK